MTTTKSNLPNTLSNEPAKTGGQSARKERYVHRNRTVHIPEGYMAIGLIVGVHGLRGEVKVELHTDFPERFAAGVTLLLGSDLTPAFIERARPHKSHMLLMLDGVNERSQAQALRGQWIFMDEADAAELDDDTFWIHDIIGLSVVTTDGRKLGEIVDLLQTGANDVYVIRTVADVNNGKELLLPAIASVVQEIDLASGTMLVILPIGLVADK